MPLLVGALVPPGGSAADDPTLAPFPHLWFDDLQVTDDTVFEHVVLHVNKTVSVNQGARLTLKGVDLRFHGQGLVHGLLVGEPRDGRPGGTLELLSDDVSSTVVQHGGDPLAPEFRRDRLGEDDRYLFSAQGELRVQGSAERPVYILDVRGKSAGAAPGNLLPAFLDGFQIVGAPNHLDHVFFASSPAGIAISSQGPTRISNLSASHVGIGLFLLASNDLVVRDSVVSASRAAVYAGDATNVTFEDTKLWGLQFGALLTRSQMRFDGAEFRGKHAGAQVHDRGEYLFEDSDFRGYGVAGLLAMAQQSKEAAETPPSVFARGNRFHGNGTGAAGVLVEAGEHIVLDGNTAEDHQLDGFHVVSAQSVELRGNRAARNANYGVQIVAAPFVEQDNEMATGADANGEGAFVATAPVRVRVENASGGPVEGASVVVTGGDLIEDLNETTDADGSVGLLLRLLRVDNNATRVEPTYQVQASKPGAIANLTRAVDLKIVLAGPIVLTPAKDARRSGDDNVPALGPLGALAAIALAIALVRRRPTG